MKCPHPSPPLYDSISPSLSSLSCTNTWSASQWPSSLVCFAVFVAAGLILCNTTVKNIGTVRLLNIQLDGPENSCSAQTPMWPSDSYNCTLQLTATQANFDAREADETSTTYLTLNVTATGMSNVTVPLVINSPAVSKADLALPIIRALAATASLDKPTINKDGRC